MGVENSKRAGRRRGIRTLLLLSVLANMGLECECRGANNLPTLDPPTVDAGSDRTVEVGDTVELDGSSTGSTATHKWQFLSQPPGSMATIQNADQLMGASFVADQVGEYEVELVGATSSNPTAPDVNPGPRDTVVITATLSMGFVPSVTTRVAVQDGQLKLIEGGAVSDIGPLFPGGGDAPEIRQLAYDWTTNVLYGVNVGRDVPNLRLFTIDVCTGEATEVGELRRPDGAAFAHLEGLAVDATG